MHQHFVGCQALSNRLEHRLLKLAFAERIAGGTDDLLEQRQALLAVVPDFHYQGEPDALDRSIGHTIEELAAPTL